MSDPRRWIDLHMHSTASDGAHRPADLMRLCAARRLSAVALTDHDTTAGLAEATEAAQEAGIELVPGVELAATLGPRSVHLLCYLFDPADAAFQQTLDQIRTWRRERNEAILARLGQLGIRIELRADPRDPPPHSIGRPHMAHALVRAGRAASFADAFSRFLAHGAAAYVPRKTLTAEESIAAARAAGGVVSLAHPCQIRCDSPPELETLVGRLKDVGLSAIEVYHSDHGPEQTRRYVEMAKRLGLAMTGGSDYHGRPGLPPPEQSIGFSHVRVSADHLDVLRSLTNARAVG